MKDIAKKLKELRISRGLTLQQAARLAGFRNFQTLSKIETGIRGIKAEELISLSKVYSFDINFFLLDRARPGEKHIFWRSNPNPPKDRSAQDKFSMFFERYMHLVEMLELTRVSFNLPTFSEETMNLKIADSYGERYAELLKLGDRPALSISSTLENEYNLPIFYLPLPEGASAISLIANGNGAICVSYNETPWRQRFDIAHELFHIIYKKSFSQKCGEDDLTFFERCANAFASAILLPKNTLEREIERRRGAEKIGIPTLIAMACDFGVSLSALIWRLVNIGRLKKTVAEKILNADAVKEYDKNFRKKEARDNPYISQKYVCMVFEAVNQGLLTRMRAAEYLNTSISKLDKIFLNAGLILKEESDIEITLM
ncbi:MAG: XRE family transcriptional regulator [candidate division WOR-3 bacterium]